VCSTHLGTNGDYFHTQHYLSGFQARSQNWEKPLLASSCPSVGVEQLGSHWTDFDEIWKLRHFFEHLSKKFKFH
jgi:hypothetical protein